MFVALSLREITEEEFLELVTEDDCISELTKLVSEIQKLYRSTTGIKLKIKEAEGEIIEYIFRFRLMPGEDETTIRCKPEHIKKRVGIYEITRLRGHLEHVAPIAIGMA